MTTTPGAATTDTAHRLRIIFDAAAQKGTATQLADLAETQMVATAEPGAFTALAAHYATENNVMAVRTARLDLHRDSIHMMRDCLSGLRPWNWLRRRRIEHQLALIAIAVAEDPPRTAPRLAPNRR